MPNLSRLAALTLLASCARPDAGRLAPNAGWTDQASGVTTSLRGVAAVSERVAWASGARNTVLRTTDGGATWERRPVPGADSLDFRSLGAIDARVAYVASAGDGAEGQARIYRTSDGGTTWTLVLADTTRGVFFDALGFWTADDGLALSDPVGGRFAVFRTSDGGRTWRRPDEMPPARDGEAAFAAGGAALTVAGSSSAWFVTGGAGGARVFRTGDRGRTWTVAESPSLAARSASAGLFAVAFRDGGVGVAVGGDYARPRAGDHVIRSADGGRSWTRAAAPPAGYWSGLAYVPGTRATLVAVGGGGTALSADDGATWARADTTELNAVSFASAAAGWAVGPRGRIVRWRGGR